MSWVLTDLPVKEVGGKSDVESTSSSSRVEMETGWNILITIFVCRMVLLLIHSLTHNDSFCRSPILDIYLSMLCRRSTLKYIGSGNSFNQEQKEG